MERRRPYQWDVIGFNFLRGCDMSVNENTLFDNLPNIVRVQALAPVLGVSILTLYDWHYRPKMRKIPESMFLKIGRNLYIRTEVLRSWITGQNPSK